MTQRARNQQASAGDPTGTLAVAPWLQVVPVAVPSSPDPTGTFAAPPFLRPVLHLDEEER